MTLLSVIKDVCAHVGVQIPQSVFSGITGNRTMQEMLAMANEQAQHIAYEFRDWQKLKLTKTFVGNGTATAWDLPANYQRMLLTSNVWRSTSQLSPMTFVSDTDEWLNHRVRNITGIFGEWTLMGGQMHIFPALSVGESAYFSYMDKNCIRLSSGGTGDQFLNDDDVFILGDRLLKLATIVFWKQNKGGAYAEDMGTFGDAMAMAMGHDAPAPIIVGRKIISRDARISYPFQTP